MPVNIEGVVEIKYTPSCVYTRQVTHTSQKLYYCNYKGKCEDKECFGSKQAYCGRELNRN